MPPTENDQQAANPRENMVFSDRGIMLTSVQDAINFATWAFESGYLPQVKNVKQAFTILARGAELGLPPFASWRYIYQTKGGKLALETKGALAVCSAHPIFADYSEWVDYEGTEDMVAYAKAERKGRKPVVKTFSWVDASTAGLLRRPKRRDGGGEYDGTYQSYLKDMMLARARGRVLDIVFPDVLGGIPVQGVAEDIDMMEDRRAEAKRAPFQQPAPKALPEGKPRASILDELSGKKPEGDNMISVMRPGEKDEKAIEAAVNEVFPPPEMELPGDKRDWTGGPGDLPPEEQAKAKDVMAAIIKGPKKPKPPKDDEGDEGLF